MQAHRRCGELDARVDGERVWMACDCGAVIAHPIRRDTHKTTSEEREVRQPADRDGKAAGSPPKSRKHFATALMYVRSLGPLRFYIPWVPPPSGTIRRRRWISRLLTSCSRLRGQ
jgi:hypothetical protein